MASTPTAIERRSRSNSLVFLMWTFLFTASFLGGDWILDGTGWRPEGAVGIAYSLIPVIPGLLAFRAYLRLYREADEMMREVQTEGILFGFGAVVLFWGAIQLPEHIWLPRVKADVVIAVMLLSFCVGIIRAQGRRM
jgi:hypothetical protein